MLEKHLYNHVNKEFMFVMIYVSSYPLQRCLTVYKEKKKMLQKDNRLSFLIDKAEKERSVLLSTHGDMDTTSEPQTPIEDRKEPSILHYVYPCQEDTDGGQGKSSETDLRRRNIQTKTSKTSIVQF